MQRGSDACTPKFADSARQSPGLCRIPRSRALEQGLIHALVTCLTTATLGTGGSSNSRQAGIMIRFEEVLTRHLSDPRLNMAQLCQLIGVTERALRSCCAEIIGMTPPR